MAEPVRGLPMTSKWDPEKLVQEVAALQELESRPLLGRAGGYIKRTGPGLLQSAMTLGAGSAAASIMAGASFGYELLWVQPVAMFLGIMMLAALGNVVLTTGERPYRSFGRELHISIAFLWALGTIVSSVIWHFPQYGLAAGAARDLGNLFGFVTEVSSGDNIAFTTAGYAISFGIGVLILAINIFTTWSYGSGAKGIRLYEWFLRTVLAILVILFGVIVIERTISGAINWWGIGRGFLGLDSFSGVLKSGWTTDKITVVLGAIGAAVGINMTFLYGYSLLAKGWGSAHKKLSRWDLGMSMFLPFVLVTSLVIIAMGSTIYRPGEGTLVRMQAVDAADALTPVLGPWLGRMVFDLGFIAMTCGAISTHMVVCGFTVCEMFGLEYTVWRYRMFTLVPVVGILGVVTTTPLWMPVATSAICFTMLPIAYIAFFIMNNKKSYIGEATGHGWKRVVFNTVLLVAIAMATIGAAIKIKGGVIDKIPQLLGKPEASAPAGQGTGTT